MTTPRQTLGQIAWEVETNGYWRQWSEVHKQERAHWERIAAAVAMQCAQICLDEAAEYLRQAQGGDNTGASDHRQQAALGCADAIRKEITSE